MEISDKIKEVRKENDELKERIKEQRDKMNDAKRTYFVPLPSFPLSFFVFNSVRNGGNIPIYFIFH